MPCECGCGQPTRIATRTDRWHGHVKGQPLRFIKGHSGGNSAAAPDRFFAKVVEVPSTDCWMWMGATVGNGYGQFFWDDRLGLAHRFAYEFFVGPIPAGLDLDHLCRNRGCTNPGHLEPVTRRENCRRGELGKNPNSHPLRTHCKRGHEFTPENVIVRPDGCRECRTCRYARNREYYHRKREEIRNG